MITWDAEIDPESLMRLVIHGAAVLACVSACGGEPTGPKAEPSAGVSATATPASIVISPDSVKLRVGQTQQVSVTVLDSVGQPIDGASVVYVSANTTVAGISATGVVTAKLAGNTVVGARSGRVSAKVPAIIRRAPPLTVSSTVLVSGCPYGVAVARSGVGYVTQTCTNSVTRFDVAGPTLTGSVPVGVVPAHVALSPDGATAYVVNQLSGNVMVLDVVTNTVTDTVSLGPREAYHALVSPNGARVYVTTNDGRVFDMNAATHVLEDSAVVGAAANGLALHPTLPRLYVSSILEATVTAVNTTTFDVERVYSVGGQLQRIAVSNNGAELYAANINGLSIINLDNGELNLIALGGACIGLALAPPGDYVYLSQWGQSRVAVVDLTDRTVYGYINTGGDPRNVVNAPGRTVVIVNKVGWLDVVR
jgi:YVTN family beta-propeller protein